ncbi:MAG: tetratricopeptide repeat protein [Xanthomonadales bacterium]|nr:tetratricopeptide repeat protein [Xanthomonadales bacterium]
MTPTPKPPPLDAWTALGAIPDAQLDLLSTSLLVARDEYPDMDIALCHAQLDEHVQRVKASLPEDAGLQQRLATLSHYLFEEVGFAGNHEAFYDPRNSYLNQVLERKLGIPLSLGVVQMEIARHLDVPLQGISFPGHFLLRLQVDGGLLVLDPYNRGRSIDAEELRSRASPHMGGVEIDDQQLMQMLEPASNRLIVMRMLRNLMHVYEEQECLDKALRCADRLVRIAPGQADTLRDRGMLYHQLGHLSAARADLSRYLVSLPNADDADAVRDLLIDSSAHAPRLN